MAEEWIKKATEPTPKTITSTPVASTPTGKKNYFQDGGDETKKGLDIVLYGDSNTGKTYLANTFPEPIYFIDTENRENKTKQFHFNKKNIKIATPLEIRMDYKEIRPINTCIRVVNKAR